MKGTSGEAQDGAIVQPVPRVDGPQVWTTMPGDQSADCVCGGQRQQVNAGCKAAAATATDSAVATATTTDAGRGTGDANHARGAGDARDAGANVRKPDALLEWTSTGAGIPKPIPGLGTQPTRNDDGSIPDTVSGGVCTADV